MLARKAKRERLLGEASTMAGETVGFEWVATTGDVVTTRNDLERSGAHLEAQNLQFRPPEGQELDYSEAAFEPLTVIAGIIGLVSLARQITAFVKDVHHDGVIVDARSQPISIRPHPSLDRGQLLVITNAGHEFYERGKGPGIEALIAAVRSG